MNRDVADYAIRKAVFDWLAVQDRVHDGALPRSLLAVGMPYQDGHIRLVGPQGIFKPAGMALPLTITTTSRGPYPDLRDEATGLLSYSYRGSNPEHPDNIGLRELKRHGIPLIYLHSPLPGIYHAYWPVTIIDDNPGRLRVLVDLANAEAAEQRQYQAADYSSAPEIEKKYLRTAVFRRLHQQEFRERVLVAYEKQCALCNLRHRELLDAAHIIADNQPDGAPVVPNGLSLCKLHHAAFDNNLFGIRPDYTVEVKPAILNESDGPMLRHGLQGIHESRIYLPRQKNLRPNTDLLGRRYEEYVRSA
jgi:putative restriction endonuclease